MEGEQVQMQTIALGSEIVEWLEFVDIRVATGFGALPLSGASGDAVLDCGQRISTLTLETE